MVNFYTYICPNLNGGKQEKYENIFFCFLIFVLLKLLQLIKTLFGCILNFWNRLENYAFLVDFGCDLVQYCANNDSCLSFSWQFISVIEYYGTEKLSQIVFCMLYYNYKSIENLLNTALNGEVNCRLSKWVHFDKIHLMFQKLLEKFWTKNFS